MSITRQRNERKVIQLLKNKGGSYRNEIARELNINVSTVRDTLKRLVNKELIQLIEKDKFQRKFYMIRNRNPYLYLLTQL